MADENQASPIDLAVMRIAKQAAQQVVDECVTLLDETAGVDDVKRIIEDAIKRALHESALDAGGAAPSAEGSR